MQANSHISFFAFPELGNLKGNQNISKVYYRDCFSEIESICPQFFPQEYSTRPCKNRLQFGKLLYPVRMFARIENWLLLSQTSLRFGHVDSFIKDTKKLNN